MSTYQTPETILRSAEEYIKIENEESALTLLLEYMTGKRPRQWSNHLEKLMTTLIDLATKFNKRDSLKEPLANFRYSSQFSNVQSLEKVIDHFIKIAEDAAAKYEKLLNDEIYKMDDLDVEAPEELFIISLSDAKTQKAIIRDSLKTLWNAYKTVIEVTAKNKKLEELNTQAIKDAYEFCQKYNRRTEFKRLCDGVRANLTAIINSMTFNPDFAKVQQFALDLTQPETNDNQIELRFKQLKFAYHFELWQEAIKTLQDINHIMQKRGSIVKPKVLYEYFGGLAKMFWKSEFFLYSAIAFFNHFVLLRRRNASAEELSEKSNHFILSVLCIPPLLNENRQSEDAKTSAASLLSSESTLLSKQDLITYIKKHNILDLCSEQVKETYFLIEESKNMSSLTKNSEPLLKAVQGQYPGYYKPLQSIIVYKLLNLLSQLYTKIKIDNFSKFLGSLDYSFCENIIHEASISDEIKVKIDHKRRLLIFRDDVKDMRNISLKLVNFSEDLKDVIHAIDNKHEQQNEAKIQQGLTDEARRYADSARGAIERRMKLIKENRKLVEEAYAKHRPKVIRDDVSESSQRGVPNLEELEREKKMDKIKNMMQLMQREKKAALIKQLKEIKGFKIGNKKFDQFTEDEIEQFTLDKLDTAKEEWDRREKEKEEAAIKNAFRRVDHLERARREEYLKILQKQWQEAKDDREEIMTTHRENFDKMVAFKNNIKGAQQFRETYCTKVREEKAETFEEEMQEFREKIIDDFKGKILEMARESLKAQQEAEIAERKKREEELAKQKERLDAERDSQIQTGFGGFARNAATGAEMRTTKPEDPKDSFRRTTAPAEEKKTGFGGIQRSTGAPKEEAKPAPTGIISRNTEIKREETKEAERPRFVNAAKKDPFGGAKPAESTGGFRRTEEPKKEEPKKEEPKKDEWRTVEKTAPTTTGGFSRNAGTTSGTTSGGPPKFSRGAGAGTSTTENKPAGGSGWRKN